MVAGEAKENEGNVDVFLYGGEIVAMVDRRET